MLPLMSPVEGLFGGSQSGPDSALSEPRREDRLFFPVWGAEVEEGWPPPCTEQLAPATSAPLSKGPGTPGPLTAWLPGTVPCPPLTTYPACELYSSLCLLRALHFSQPLQTHCQAQARRRQEPPSITVSPRHDG